jgi:hypothetical protein
MRLEKGLELLVPGCRYKLICCESGWKSTTEQDTWNSNAGMRAGSAPEAAAAGSGAFDPQSSTLFPFDTQSKVCDIRFD